DDVIAAVAACKVHAFEREIVGLASATGEDDFIRLASEQFRNLFAGSFNCGFCRRRRPVPARWIAEIARKKRQHCRANRRVNRCARIVVEIDRRHARKLLRGFRKPAPCRRRASYRQVPPCCCDEQNLHRLSFSRGETYSPSTRRRCSNSSLSISPRANRSLRMSSGVRLGGTVGCPSPPAQRTRRTTTAITAASTRIMNSGPNIMPYHPPPHIICGP